MTSVHSLSIFSHPLAKLAAVSPEAPQRLVVFVHGWGGSGDGSWGDFLSPPADDWWRASDLLFVDYRSRSEGVVATADRIRRHIGDFYPHPRQEILTADGEFARADVGSPYRELILVGHSAGGLVLRRALADAFREWKVEEFNQATRPPLLDAELRLFSPASAGFNPRGVLGALATAPTWWLFEMLLRRGAYPDLDPDSEVIVNTRLRTQEFAKDPRATALVADIVWANPEDIVNQECYNSDRHTTSIDGKNHSRVCKPTSRYKAPFRFVANGVKTGGQV